MDALYLAQDRWCPLPDSLRALRMAAVRRWVEGDAVEHGLPPVSHRESVYQGRLPGYYPLCVSLGYRMSRRPPGWMRSVIPKGRESGSKARVVRPGGPDQLKRRGEAWRIRSHDSLLKSARAPSATYGARARSSPKESAVSLAPAVPGRYPVCPNSMPNRHQNRHQRPPSRLRARASAWQDWLNHRRPVRKLSGAVMPVRRIEGLPLTRCGAVTFVRPMNPHRVVTVSVTGCRTAASGSQTSSRAPLGPCDGSNASLARIGHGRHGFESPTSYVGWWHIPSPSRFGQLL
jgi:hypothetical protein